MSIPDIRIVIKGEGAKGRKIQKSLQFLPRILNREFPGKNWTISEENTGISCEGKNSLFFFKLPAISPRYIYGEIYMLMDGYVLKKDSRYHVLTETDDSWSEGCELFQMIADQLSATLKR